MSSLWNTFVYIPLYNALILITAFTPGHSVGVAVITLTIAVKIALLPMTIRASKAQRAMKEIDPEIKELRNTYANDKQQLATKTMELYKEKGVNPASGCLPIIIQLPFIIALYQLMWRGLSLHSEALYAFVPHPEALNMMLFGINLAGKNILLAVLAGLTQFLQTKFLFPNTKSLFEKQQSEMTMQEEFTRSLNIQMLFIFPILISYISYRYSAAVALYFITSNIVGIGQEYYLRATKQKSQPTP